MLTNISWHLKAFGQCCLTICSVPLLSCFWGQGILLNVAHSCYLLFYVLLPLGVSGALSCCLMPFLMSKCWVDCGKIQRNTIITAYVATEEDLSGHLLLYAQLSPALMAHWVPSYHLASLSCLWWKPSRHCWSSRAVIHVKSKVWRYGNYRRLQHMHVLVFF